LHSDQAVAANEYLNRPENAEFLKELYVLEYAANTVIMEWCAPDNRIVLPYEDAHLKVLGVRNRDTFTYGNYGQFEKFDWDEIPARWTHIYKDVEDPEQFLKDIEQAQNIEGVVVRLNSGQRFKKKCEWYLALHHTKDTINSPRRLFEAVLEEASDDLRSLFHDDPMAIAQIEEMEKFVEEKYNHMVDTVERFYERNKHMERKDYAILGQEELSRMYFGLAMSRYLGKEVDYKDFLKGKWKALGLKDEVQDDD
jgi:RNA ligase